jgi:hypothetical protein
VSGRVQIECDICNEFAQIAWDNSEKLDEIGIEAVWWSARLLSAVTRSMACRRMIRPSPAGGRGNLRPWQPGPEERAALRRQACVPPPGYRQGRRPSTVASVSSSRSAFCRGFAWVWRGLTTLSGRLGLGKVDDDREFAELIPTGKPGQILRMDWQTTAMKTACHRTLGTIARGRAVHSAAIRLSSTAISCVE